MAEKGIRQRREERRKNDNEQSDARYKEILSAGAQVFRERGYLQAALQDVADAVGISRPTLYYYISTKEELLTEILKGPIDEATRMICEIASSDASARDRLKRAIALHMETIETYHPEMFIFFAERLHVGRRTRRIRENSRLYGEAIAKIIEDGQRRGEFRKDIDARVAMLGILGMFNWIHRWYEKAGPLTLPAIGKQFEALALDGLRPPP
jgi:TetR/AcrR family transcriptional regulator, cholesterol catabolism regulator